MISIGNDELAKAPNLSDFIICPRCKEHHIIKYGDEILKDGTRVKSKLLAFYSCGGKLYLAGIDGKDIMKH